MDEEIKEFEERFLATYKEGLLAEDFAVLGEHQEEIMLEKDFQERLLSYVLRSFHDLDRYAEAILQSSSCKSNLFACEEKIVEILKPDLR